MNVHFGHVSVHERCPLVEGRLYLKGTILKKKTTLLIHLCGLGQSLTYFDCKSKHNINQHR